MLYDTYGPWLLTVCQPQTAATMPATARCLMPVEADWRGDTNAMEDDTYAD